jgi:hypothetical protein
MKIEILPQSYLECLDMEMLNSEDQQKAHQLCLEFLRGVEKTNRINYEHTTYGYKHMVEGWPHRGYVYEATFIIAAFETDFTVKQLRQGCLKSVLNTNEQSLINRIRDWSPTAAISMGSVGGGGTFDSLFRAAGIIK